MVLIEGVGGPQQPLFYLLAFFGLGHVVLMEVPLGSFLQVIFPVSRYYKRNLLRDHRVLTPGATIQWISSMNQGRITRITTAVFTPNRVNPVLKGRYGVGLVYEPLQLLTQCVYAIRR